MSKASRFVKPLCAAFLAVVGGVGCASGSSSGSSAPGSAPGSPTGQLGSQASQAATAHPVATRPMTPTQKLGVDVIMALTNNAALKSGTSISVGTSKDTVTLNGSVSSAAQKQLAFRIARKQAPKFKIVNQLTVKPLTSRPS